MIPKDFVKKYWPFAVESEKMTNISAYATMAQAALETGWGKSAPGGMLFGVKATKNWKGERQLIWTKEYHDNPNVQYPEIKSITKQSDGRYLYICKDWFRKYDSQADAFADHGRVILNAKRNGKLIYESAILVRSDARRFIEEIAKSGYATDVNYALKLKKIIAIIERQVTLQYYLTKKKR